MESRHKDLLNALLYSQKDWTTAGVLSGYLGISVRSVKTRIADINSLYTDVIIPSSKGYKADKERIKQLFLETDTRLPYTPKERIRIILQNLIRREPLDLFELCEEELFISVETARKDLAAAKKLFARYNLRFAVNDFMLVLEGTEIGKRRLFSSVLHEEFDKTSFSLSAIERVFPECNVRFVYDTILEHCKRRQYFINEYSILTIILDIAIGIERIKNSHVLKENTGNIPNYGPFADPTALALANDIIRRIGEHYGISYSGGELNETVIIIVSSLVKTSFNQITMKDIKKYIEYDCLRLIAPLEAGLASYEFIDINDHKFMPRFLLHINNLLLRLKNGYIRKNPLTGHIKKTYPLLFDCAAALSEIIYKNIGLRVDEHETAYIALHLGSFHDVSGMRDMASCVLLFPGYYDYEDRLIAQITENFGVSLMVQTVVSRIEELQDISPPADLIISVVPLPDHYAAESVYVNPFMLEQDINKIRAKLDKIRNNKKKARLLRELGEIISPALFCADIPLENEEAAIRYMSTLMIQNGYAEALFTDEVLSREKNYSTAYGNLAVPHSMRQNAQKTGMCVLINRRPIHWGQEMVNIVLLFSIQKETRNIFYDVFENLIVLLLEPANRTKIMGCKSYDAFINTIIDCL
jgi:lichenan operon transcriptional antiterminator